MELKEVKKEIKDYVRDHYKYYGWYPYDVQVGDVLLLGFPAGGGLRLERCGTVCGLLM